MRGWLPREYSHDFRVEKKHSGMVSITAQHCTRRLCGKMGGRERGTRQREVEKVRRLGI